ncbi:MAG: M20 family metallopeptidase [Ascidiaceihabitans sp.]|jgi:amidohydrolase|nr:M20 family metallopeptidase [Ascidiaceihabitans sp.]
MAIVNRIAGYADEMTGWRRHLHTIPELGRECFKTAAFVEEKLREFGVDEIQTGFATTGIVAIINGQGNGPTIGLRADMDGLPIIETTGLEYQSTHEGRMHACGHDGHTTMLLGAAKYLCETRNFSGRVALIFQPDEEATGGAEAMVEEGILDTFDISQVYGIHNMPEFPVGGFFTTTGPLMAGADVFDINIKGRGGHGAMPHGTVDPILAACSIAQAIQSIVSRNVDAAERLVISVTQIHTGSVDNVIPDTAYMNGTVRSFTPEVRDLAERRLREIVAGQAASYGCEADVVYNRGYPATYNSAEGVVMATKAARDVSGDEAVVDDFEPVMGSEDFSYMLQKRSGAYLFMGQGPSAGLHHPEYNFNDDVAPVGASFFARLVETAQPVGS